MKKKELTLEQAIKIATKLEKRGIIFSKKTIKELIKAIKKDVLNK